MQKHIFYFTGSFFVKNGIFRKKVLQFILKFDIIEQESITQVIHAYESRKSVHNPVVFCDDSLLVAEIIKDYTQAALPKERAFDLRVFDDPKKLLEEWDTAFADAVMLDINMPQIDGFSLAERLEQDKPDVMIVFVSGYEDRVFQSYAYHPFWIYPQREFGTNRNRGSQAGGGHWTPSEKAKGRRFCSKRKTATSS